MFRKGIIDVQDCVICSNEIETIGHLFFNCELSKEVSKRILEEMGINRQIGDSAREWSFIARRCKGRSKKARKTKNLVATTVYAIWCERNRRLFQNESLGNNSMVQQIKSFLNLRNNVF